ncbi:MAG: hypothetical protein ACXACC_02635 [Promethearchaeota archaeon]|jgi:hypothetical protein
MSINNLEKWVFKLNLKRIVFLNLIVIAFVLGFFYQIDYSKAQVEGESLTFPANFTMEEFTENINRLDNTTSIEIPLPSRSWNLTGLQLNFSNIKPQSEIKPIEDQEHGDYEPIYYSTPSWKTYGLGVQLNLTETTRIFGAYIYGYKSPETTKIIQVQIRGYDDAEKKPNNTIYAFTNINVSLIPGWYLQSFNSSVKLPKGNYYLVLFGIVSGNDDYYWAYNEHDPTDPNLYSSKYINNWNPGVQNAPHLYKLIQKVNKSYNPEEINMTAEINGGSYDILNSTNPYSGILSINGLNWNVNDTNLHIPVKNDLDIELNFTLDYDIKLKNYLPSNASVVIEAEKDNIWTLTPKITKYFWNYSIKFSYPTNWNNLMVFRDGVNISSLIYIDSFEKSLLLTNNTIINGAEWNITATSPLFNFGLDIRLYEYGPGQELRFLIDEPPTPGNYTLILYDPVDLPIDDAQQTISLPAESNLFSYTFDTHPLEGEYLAYVYFFDGTNAGVETATFVMTVPFTIDPFTLFLIILASVIVISVTTSIVVVVKKHKRKVEAYKEEVFNKCMDIININYIMVSEKKSSLNVYEQVFTKQKLDPTLISGFLSAIHSFGIELTNTDEKTQTIKLEYKNSKVLMSEFKGFRIVIIMNELPSQKFFDSISNLALDIETQYSRYLENFKGNIDHFKGIEDLLKKHLSISFLYPLKIVKTGKTKVSQTEKIMIGRALEAMKKNNQKYFYTTHIMEVKVRDSKDIEAIFNLIDNNIFQPVI